MEYDQLVVGKMEEDVEIVRLRAALEETQKALQDAQERAKSKKAELQNDFQQQVDEAFIYDYTCCMKKNKITNNAPCIPSDDEELAAHESDPAVTEGNSAAEGGESHNASWLNWPSLTPSLKSLELG